MYGLVYLFLSLFGLFLSAFATTIALYVDDHDSFSAITTMISMPLFFTSSALMPYDVMPGWLRPIASANPLSFAIDAIRSLGAGSVPVFQIAALVLLASLVLRLSVRVFRRVTL